MNIETKKFPNSSKVAESEFDVVLPIAIYSFNQMVKKEGELEAYKTYLHDYCSLYRDGIIPKITKQVQLDLLVTSPFEYRYSNYYSEMSESGDFGYEFGSMEITDKQTSLITNYNFCRIWKLVGSEWKIIMDLRISV